MQAKGPNALNINAYVNGQEEEGEYLQEATSSRPNIDIKAIEDQFDNFVRDMQKYDRILSEVARNIEEIDAEGDFITDFYPKLISEATYEDEQEKRIVNNTDPDLAKVILNLERSNALLKQDMRSWVLEFAKTAKLTEVLIGENKVLRQSIAGKNREIVRLIEGIGQAENEEVAELVEGLEVLREENGVLKEHLLRLREEVAEKRGEEGRLEEMLGKAREEFSRLEREKGEAEDEEEHLTKTFELIEQWKAQTERSKRRLEKEREGLQARRQELEEERERIERELSICTREKKDLEGGLKREYQQQEEEKYRLMEEIHQLGDAISKQKEESRYYEDQILRNNNKKNQYQKIAKDYIKRAADNEEQLKQLRKELEASQNAQISLQCEIELERYDIEALSKQLKELQEKERRMGEEWKRGLKAKEEEKGQEIASWQSKMSEKQRELEMKIRKERAELGTKQKELEKWEQKVYEKKEELTDLKTQLKEIKDNQLKLAELKNKLHAQENN